MYLIETSKLGTERANILINFRYSRWGSSLPGLCMLDPPLSASLTPSEIFGERVREGGEN